MIIMNWETFQVSDSSSERNKRKVKSSGVTHESETVGDPWKCLSISMVLNSDQLGGGRSGIFKSPSRLWSPENLSRVKSWPNFALFVKLFSFSHSKLLPLNSFAPLKGICAARTLRRDKCRRDDLNNLSNAS